MCGITGWIDWQQNVKQQALVIEQMTDTLIPRGPDAAGYWLSTHCAFGHRRLSVMDPANGAQPMVFERDGQPLVLTYNGELYNAPELRRELESLGYRFRTDCDTEVLLYACAEWGKTALTRLNGIFAFALWDERRQTCLLVRDRLGVKPLFFARLTNGLLFASEPKALLQHPQIEPEVDLQGMAEIWGIGPARTPGHAVFRQMEELKPGHWLEFSRKGIQTGCYWSLRSQPHEDDVATTASKLNGLLSAAMKRQLQSDVPLCTLLSGGLDSSALSALAVAFGGYDTGHSLLTCSVDYEDQSRYFQGHAFQPNRDAPYIDAMSRYLGTDHHSIELSIEQLIGSLDDVVRARDLPGMADIDGSLLLFCREIKRRATVAISGEAADEIFAGYPWFAGAGGRIGISAATGANGDVTAGGQAGFPWSGSLELRSQILSPEMAAQLNVQDYARERYKQAVSEALAATATDSPVCEQERQFQMMSYLNITRFMPTLLDRKDRMSMACGLEVRVPFCDHELVEYAFNIPRRIKQYNDREKGILRLALNGQLPDDVLWRKKSPYPKTYHPAYTKAMREAVLVLLSDVHAPVRAWLNVEHIRRLASDISDNVKLPWFGQLMSGPQFFAYLLQVNTWLKEYKIRVV